MAAFNHFYQYSEDIHQKVHDFTPSTGDTLKVALSNSAPVQTNTQLTDITEIAYTNFQNGGSTGRDLTIKASSGQTTGSYKLIIDDLVLTATGTTPTFRYVVIYNETATNDELVGWADYGGSGISLSTNETFTIDFDNVNGLLSHSWT